MLPKYPTTTEIDLDSFTTNLSDAIAKSPEQYGLTQEFAAQYRDAQRTFSEARYVAQNPNTRTTVSIAEKNAAMKELKRLTTQCVRTIQKQPALTDCDRGSLGLPIPRTSPAREKRLEWAPDLAVLNTHGYTVKVRLRQQEHPDRTGRPQGAAGALLCYFVGEWPEPDQWTVLCETKKTLLDVELPAMIPDGARVWLTAAWFNASKKQSPAALPVSLFVCRMLGETSTRQHVNTSK